MNTADIIKKRKKRWADFMAMQGNIDHVYLINVEKSLPKQVLLWPDKEQERIEWILTKYNRQVEQIQWLEDDRIPYLDMLTGTEVFAEAFGCKVYRPRDNNPFALPLIHDASEVAKIKKPRLEDSTLSYLFDMADELKKRAGKDAIFRLPDIQSPMDISALIWDKNTFYIAMIEEPNAVKELAAMVKELLMEFLDAWFSRYGHEYIAHFPEYYMVGGMTLSEDEIGAVNEHMFDEFFLQELTELSEHFGGLGMHCCANARHQWDNIKKIPKLRLLNLVQPQIVVAEALEYFKEYVPQMHSWSGDGPAWTWVGQHPKGARVAMEVNVKNREEALEAAEKLWAACGR